MHGGQQFRVYTAALPIAPGDGLVRTSRAANADDGALRNTALLLAGLTVAATAVTYGAARLTAGRVLRPIAELTAAAEHVTGPATSPPASAPPGPMMRWAARPGDRIWPRIPRIACWDFPAPISPRLQIEVLRRPVESAQYTSAEFAGLATDCAVTLSHGRTGQCWDNALAESFFASIKGELLDSQAWPTRDLARRAIVEYIAWYNGAGCTAPSDTAAPPSSRKPARSRR